MPRQYERAYEVIKTEDYIRQFNEIHQRYPKAIELNNAIVWALERYPQGFENIMQDFYHWITEELSSPGFPVVKILFRVFADKKVVVLLSMQEL